LIEVEIIKEEFEIGALVYDEGDDGEIMYRGINETLVFIKSLSFWIRLVENKFFSYRLHNKGTWL
jgi:hypothetical protein